MIWNLSERTYDYSVLDNQVIEFHFPGYPSPPLDKIFAICRSIDGWLRADTGNIAVLHCQTGRGRTVTAIACYLAWTGAFASPQEAMEHIATVKNVECAHLVIPSQRRYMEYFSNILSGKFPSGRPLKLDRIILNTTPSIDADGSCRPYVQVFKYAKLLQSSAGKTSEISTYHGSEPAVFNVNCAIDGDILIRVRHFAQDGSRISIMRFTFHTGYITDLNLRIPKADVDGACNDKRFSDDFHIDLVFSYVDDDDDDDDGPADADSREAHWKDMTYRQAETPKAKTIPTRFTLFSDGTEDEKFPANDNDSEGDDMDAYISSLKADGDVSDVGSDTDDLLAELQKEMRAAEPDRALSPSKTDIAAHSQQETDLDAEISQLLAE